MGTITNSVEFHEGADPGPVSRGATRVRRSMATVALSTSYATGGDTLNIPSDIGALKGVFVAPMADGTRYYSWNGSTSTPKIQSYVQATGAESAATTNLSTVTLQVMAIFEQ